MSIEAMKQALEALEVAANGGGVNFYEYAKDLRQAIAEASQNGLYREGYRNGYAFGEAAGKRQAIAEAEQEQGEPVTVTHRHEWFRTGEMKVGQMRCISCGAWGQEDMPQQRKPLTDEEIVAIVREASRGSAIRRDGSTSLRIARAIEAAHGIKE